MNRRDFLNGLMVGAAALGTSAAIRPISAFAEDAKFSSMQSAPRILSIGYRSI
jgi:hypothetical protein